MRLARVRQLTPHLKTASAKKEKKVIVVGNSLLSGNDNRTMSSPLGDVVLLLFGDEYPELEH